MDRNGGCCIARYAGGGGAYDVSSKVDRIMLRFRPIAPKPVAAGSGSGSGSSTSSRSSPETSDGSPKSRRGKRKCNDATKRCSRKKKQCLRSEDQEKVVTLALLPEIPDRKDSPVREFPPDFKERRSTTNTPPWLSFGSNNNAKDRGAVADRAVVSRMVGSCVTVEFVTDTWMVDDGGLGCTDKERRLNLERDTCCPGLISDKFGMVTWTNEAYRKLVGHDADSSGDDENNQVPLVWLVMKESVPVTVRLADHRAFSCRVRVQYGNYYVKEMKGSVTVPCDAWRMDGGGFAWRLDVKAALCLGRYVETRKAMISCP